MINITDETLLETPSLGKIQKSKSISESTNKIIPAAIIFALREFLSVKHKLLNTTHETITEYTQISAKSGPKSNHGVRPA